MSAIYKYIFEVRFIPNPRFLDIRGEVTKHILSFSTSVSQWKIDTNRIDISDDLNTKNIYVSYKAIGFSTQDKQDIEPFLRAVESVISNYFYDAVPTRFGVRTVSLFSTRERMKSLLTRFTSTLYKNNINQELKDVASTFVFVSKDGEFTVNIGPSERKQSSEIFSGKNIPKVGIFIDVDTYREDFDNPELKGDLLSKFRKLVPIKLKLSVKFSKDGFSKNEAIINEYYSLISNEDKK